ncbi:MAG: sel1 repeat family protein, partial [Firmicutes bacterium]|nr:sel1 repeat family protein [Bacillota bacterium]
MKGKLFGIMCILLTVMCVYAAAEDACLSGNEDHEKGITSFITGDYDSAMEHWLKAAQSGDNGALFDIGWMLWFDQDILDNQEQYTYWSEKAKEAGYYDFDEENVHIAYELGLFNHFDIPDINDAVYWYRRAALGGNVLSMRFLAEIFHDHESALYDIEEAAHWYQQAAEAGDVEAMYSIGKMFRSGEGVPQDEQQAVYWLMKAAETDYEEGLSYYNTKYYSPVMRYWERAAEAGHVNAMYMLGQMYGLGLSSMDFDQAIYWCQKAAEVGHSDARYMVEQMYDFYKSKNPDIDQAIFWCQKAAEVGHLNAMYSLAEMYRHGYYNGIIVQENPQLAVYWYQRAGEAGCVDAMYEIAE